MLELYENGSGLYAPKGELVHSKDVSGCYLAFVLGKNGEGIATHFWPSFYEEHAKEQSRILAANGLNPAEFDKAVIFRMDRYFGASIPPTLDTILRRLPQQMSAVFGSHLGINWQIYPSYTDEMSPEALSIIVDVTARTYTAWFNRQGRL